MLEAQVGHRQVARQFGVSASALYRHWASHVPQVLAHAAALQSGDLVPPSDDSDPPVSDAHALEVARAHHEAEERKDQHAIDAFQQLRAINAACLEVLREARKRDDHLNLLRAVDRIARQIDLQARLLGQIQEAPTFNVAILPEWHGIRQKVLEALQPHPEARLAVIQALEEAT